MLDGNRARIVDSPLPESLMKVAYVVLYVNDAETCRRFWVEQAGMVEKRRTHAGGVQASEIGEHAGTPSFAFADPEGHRFAVTA